MSHLLTYSGRLPPKEKGRKRKRKKEIIENRQPVDPIFFPVLLREGRLHVVVVVRGVRGLQGGRVGERGQDGSTPTPVPSPLPSGYGFGTHPDVREWTGR